MIIAEQDIINYLSKKYAWRLEYGIRENKPAEIFIKDKHVVFRWCIGQSSGFGAFSASSMPQGGGLIRTNAYMIERYYINDMIVEMFKEGINNVTKSIQS